MTILVIGGTGFIGRWITAQLRDAGHTVTVFHRGATAAPEGVREIVGARADLPAKMTELAGAAPEVIIDTILSSSAQARESRALAERCGARLVGLSSMDVYRAAAVLHGLDPGPPDPCPLKEDSPLRSGGPVYSPEALVQVRAAFGWVDDEYDKVAVERALPDAIILRLPMVYGPGDPLRRLHPVIKRVKDQRPAIVLEESHFHWRPCRGYVENVAAAAVLAATSEAAHGRIYNVAETDWLNEGEWTERVARSAGFGGRVVAIPRDRAPRHLVLPYRLEQHWFADSQRIRSELAYQEPVATEEGIRRTVAWEKDNPPPRVDAGQFDYAAEDAALAG